MNVIGFDREDDAISWARERIGITSPVGFCRAYAAVDDAGDFVFVVVLSNFSPDNIDMHIAGRSGGDGLTPRAAVALFNGVFGYAFDQHKVARVTGLVPASNVAAQEFDERLGFRIEGRMRKALRGEDVLIYGFLREDYERHAWRRKQG